LATQCPACGYNFSDKDDFEKYSAAGEIIECPVCHTELKLDKQGQLVEVDLESEDYKE
jgi:hypothetical protein